MQSFGSTPITTKLINSTIQESLTEQAFAFHAVSLNGTSFVVGTGAPVDPGAWHKATIAIGPLYGMYAALEAMGFAFTHPLSPIYPASLQPPAALSAPHVHRFAWPIRSWHYHTEHPLDLQEVLNGFDAGSVAALMTTGGQQHPHQRPAQQLPRELLAKGGIRGGAGGLDAASVAARRTAVAGAISTFRSAVQAVAPAGGDPCGRAARRYGARPSGGKDVKGGVGDATLRAEDIHKVKRVTSGELDHITSHRRPLSGEMSPQSSSTENTAHSGRLQQHTSALEQNGLADKPTVETSEGGPSEPRGVSPHPARPSDSPSRGALRDNTDATAGDVRMRLSGAGMGGSHAGLAGDADADLMRLEGGSGASSGNSSRHTPTKLPPSPKSTPPGVSLPGDGGGSPGDAQPMVVKAKPDGCCTIM